MTEDPTRLSTPGDLPFEQLATSRNEAAPMLTIAEAARAFGVTPRALRFYESKGLLSPRRQGAVRLYDRPEQERLALVLKARDLGFTLAETERMLASRGEPATLNISRRQCHEQIKHLEQRKRAIELALAELRRTYSSFYARIAAMPDRA